ncbi:hypothetical protein V6Z11_A12G071600 [Gossypium hirsutum]
MLNLSVEGLTLVVQNHYGILIVAVLSITITSLLLKAWGSTVDLTDEDGIPGRLGLPFFGETSPSFRLLTAQKDAMILLNSGENSMGSGSKQEYSERLTVRSEC